MFISRLFTFGLHWLPLWWDTARDVTASTLCMLRCKFDSEEITEPVDLGVRVTLPPAESLRAPTHHIVTVRPRRSKV